MKTVISMLAALALVLLCSACGTVRAIQGDRESKAPRLLAVTPTQVASGQGSGPGQQKVTFSAQIVDQTGLGPGDGAITGNGEVGDVVYFWDFGGGAEPNTSTDPEPQVVIRDGARSPYDARLVLTDATSGEAQEYTFQIFVTPLEVAAVVPSTVFAGSQATFSTLVRSGVASTWNWDFGGAASPGGSNLQAPTVQITDIPGTYNAKVFVSNAYESIEVPFTITVFPAAAP